MDMDERVGPRFDRLIAILALLRSDEGCPWDRQQDERTIADYFLEEVYEAVDAVLADDARRLEEELGDVLMEVVFLAQIYREKGRFSMASVLDGINQKMTRRHPHVFATKSALSCQEVTASWQEQKNSEKRRRTAFEGLAESAPALLQAFQAGQRAAARGADWPSVEDVLDKVRQELGEVEKALGRRETDPASEEIGNLLFAVASLSRVAGHNPELALRAATRKFKERFSAMEEEPAKARRKVVASGQDNMEETRLELKKKGS